jgi:acylphosphatase
MLNLPRPLFFDATLPGGKSRLLMRCRLFRIEGRVQGVWFRESTRREAIALGIAGYAKNMADGSVEVLACGDAAALERLAEWLRHGPPMAQVNNVEWIVAESQSPVSFVTR